jgi:hypothetical protein
MDEHRSLFGLTKAKKTNNKTQHHYLSKNIVNFEVKNKEVSIEVL